MKIACVGILSIIDVEGVWEQVVEGNFLTQKTEKSYPT